MPILFIMWRCYERKSAMTSLRYKVCCDDSELELIRAKMYFYGARDVAVADWRLTPEILGVFKEEADADKAKENIDKYLDDPNNWNDETGFFVGFSWIEAEPLPEKRYKLILKKIWEVLCRKKKK